MSTYRVRCERFGTHNPIEWEYSVTRGDKDSYGAVAAMTKDKFQAEVAAEALNILDGIRQVLVGGPVVVPKHIELKTVDDPMIAWLKAVQDGSIPRPVIDPDKVNERLHEAGFPPLYGTADYAANVECDRLQEQGYRHDEDEGNRHAGRDST